MAGARRTGRCVGRGVQPRQRRRPDQEGAVQPLGAKHRHDPDLQLAEHVERTRDPRRHPDLHRGEDLLRHADRIGSHRYNRDGDLRDGYCRLPADRDTRSYPVAAPRPPQAFPSAIPPAPLSRSQPLDSTSVQDESPNRQCDSPDADHPPIGGCYLRHRPAPARERG